MFCCQLSLELASESLPVSVPCAQPKTCYITLTPQCHMCSCLQDACCQGCVCVACMISSQLPRGYVPPPFQLGACLQESPVMVPCAYAYPGRSPWTQGYPPLNNLASSTAYRSPWRGCQPCCSVRSRSSAHLHHSLAATFCSCHQTDALARGRSMSRSVMDRGRTVPMDSRAPEKLWPLHCDAEQIR